MDLDQPPPVTKEEALRAVSETFQSRQYSLAKNTARECVQMIQFLSTQEKMFLAIVISADTRPCPHRDRDDKQLAHELWSNATRRLPRKYYSAAAGYQITLAERFLDDLNTIAKAYDALWEARSFLSVTDNGVLTRYREVVRRYEEIAGLTNGSAHLRL